MSKNRDLQALYHLYRQETGVKEVDMHEVARFAVRKGWRLPDPVDPVDRLARDFARAAREETRRDSATGRPYRANHAVPYPDENGQLNFFWVDIEEATRPQMLKSLVRRREQTAGDVIQLKFDEEHWNRIRPTEAEPIDLPTDYTLDVELAMHKDDEEAAG